MILGPKKEISRDVAGNPFKQMEQMQKRMLRMFPSLLGEEDVLQGAWMPPVDVHDQRDKIIVRAELAGVGKDDLEVMVENNNLIVKGHKRQSSETKEGEYVRTESYYGSFNRSFSLPPEVDTKHIHAQFKDGILEIEIPKKEEEIAQQKIDIS